MIPILILLVFCHLCIAGLATVHETKLYVRQKEADLAVKNGKCSKTRPSGRTSEQRADTKTVCAAWHGKNCWRVSDAAYVYEATLRDVGLAYLNGLIWFVRFPAFFLHYVANRDAAARKMALLEAEARAKWEAAEKQAEADFFKLADKIAAETFADNEQFLMRSHLELEGLPVVEDHPELEVAEDPKEPVQSAFEQEQIAIVVSELRRTARYSVKGPARYQYVQHNEKLRKALGL